jgi:drug/metabolite transporter (DMT)-like permease
LSAARPGGIGLSRGLLYMVLAAVFFSVMSLFVKLAGARLPPSQIVLARSVVTLVISWLYLSRAGISPWGNRRGLLFLRGLFGFIALFCFYYAIIHLPLAEATVIQYTNPVFTAVLAAILIGEAMTRRGVACLLLGLLGVALVARPAALLGFGGEPLPPLSVAIALTGAFLSGLVYVIVRKLGQTEHPLVVVLWFPLVALPATIPMVIPVWTAPTALEWLFLLGVGVSAQIAQVFMTRGLHLERAGPATTVSYLQIVFAASWGLLVFGEIPDGWTFAGTALIVGAALLLRRRPGSSQRRQEAS